MKIIKAIAEMQEVSERFRLQAKKIAVVPTMGYLHRGHTSLIELARSIADIVITTIFVNPIQFGPNEDYERYPRDFSRDIKSAEDAGADIIFYPNSCDMYVSGHSSYIEVEGVTETLEGKFRPKHFRGVTTVVAKLMNITKPHFTVFGQKDAQQAFIIKKMIKDLNYDVQIIIAPIIREPDGLAMSSRNVYLTPTERKNALVLHKALTHANQRIQNGERSIEQLKIELNEIILSGEPTQIDYIAFIDPEDFHEVESIVGKEILIAVAVRFGLTRLIDNILIKIEK